MIKANDLRTGNIVNYEDHVGNKYTKEVTVDDLVEAMEMFDEGQKKNRLYPIPLTPEILEKAGFVDSYMSKDDRYKWKRGCKLYFIDGKFVYDTLQDKITVIKYVHQLQNLYFALTGEELEIKL